jgi:hypothetical protein
MMSADVPAVAYLNLTGGNYWLEFASYDPSKSAWSKTQLAYLTGTPQGLSLDVYNDSNMSDQPVIAVQPELPSYWGVNLWYLSGGIWQQGNAGLGPYEGYSTAVKGMTNGQVGLVFDDQPQLHGITRGPIAYWRDIPSGGK